LAATVLLWPSGVGMAASGLVLLAKSRSVDRLLGAAYAVAAFPTYQLEPEEREHVANGGNLKLSILHTSP
jgi:hypothetical protein